MTHFKYLKDKCQNSPKSPPNSLLLFEVLEAAELTSVVSAFKTLMGV